MISSIPLILHPGFGKCGSTSIQHFVYRNELVLRDHGIFIPDSKLQFTFETSRSPAQPSIPLWYFYDFLENSKPIELLEERLDRLITSAQGKCVNGLLISSEILAVTESPGTVRVHKVLASRFPNTKILLYIRKQDDWILSSWQQWGHKAGYSLQEWCEYCMDTGRPSFLKTAEALEAIYGSEAVTVVPLHQSAFKNRSLLEDFRHHAGLAHIDFGQNKDDSPVNVSLNPYLCEILALSSHVYPSRDDESIKELLLHYGKDSGLLLRRRPDFMSLAQRSSIMKFYREDNRLLHKRYFSNSDFDIIFSSLEPHDIKAESVVEETINHEALAIQMELILSLMEKVNRLESERANSSFKKLLKNLIFRRKF